MSVAFGASLRRRDVRGASARLACAVVLSVALAAAPAGSPSWPVGPATAFAAATCTGWPSDSAPPSTIRVLRTTGPAASSVQVVPFRDYVNVVMAAEWGATNPPEVLKAGAVAVKEFAWYHAMFWRGGTADDGSCYDVVDSSLDQVYSPETRIPAASLTAAVDATWGISVQKNTGLFVTHYQAGDNVPCGANADGLHLYQVSAAHCAQDGMTFDIILSTYYGPGLVIVGGQAAAPAPTALRFLAQPSGGAAGLVLPVQPVVAIVDATGQVFPGDPSTQTMVALALAAPVDGVVLTCADGLSRQAIGGIATFDGCQLSGTAPGIVLVASSAGLPPVSTPPFAVTPAPPSLTLSASAAAISWGSPVQLTGALVPAGPEDASGRTLHLQRSTDGIAWTPVVDLATDANGAAGAADVPAANTFYRLAFDGTPDMAAAASPAIRVVVRRVVQLRPDSGGAIRPVMRGTSVAFSATVRPQPASGSPGRVEYRLYQLVGRSWVVKRTWSVAPDATGVARLRVTFGSRGTWSVRVVALATPATAISILSPAQRYNVR